MVRTVTNVSVLMASKDVIAKTVFKVAMLTHVKPTHAQMVELVWLLEIHSNASVLPVTKAPDVKRKLEMPSRQFVIQTLVSMEVHVKKMEKAMTVFVMFNILVHSAKLTNVRNAIHTPSVLTDTVNAGQDGMEMVMNASRRKDVQNRVECMQLAILMFVHATVVTKETDTTVFRWQPPQHHHHHRPRRPHHHRLHQFVIVILHKFVWKTDNAVIQEPHINGTRRDIEINKIMAFKFRLYNTHVVTKLRPDMCKR